MPDNDTIRTEEIRRFANALGALQDAFRALADWLNARDIQEIPGAGTPTAKRGIGYLAGFTSAILKAYTDDQLQVDADDQESGRVAASLWGAERMLRTAGKKRLPNGAKGKHKPDAPEGKSPIAKKDAAAAFDTSMDMQRAKKKRAKK